MMGEFKFLMDKTKRSKNIDLSGYRQGVVQRRVEHRLDRIVVFTFESKVGKWTINLLESC